MTLRLVSAMSASAASTAAAARGRWGCRARDITSSGAVPRRMARWHALVEAFGLGEGLTGTAAATMRRRAVAFFLSLQFTGVPWSGLAVRA